MYRKTSTNAVRLACFSGLLTSALLWGCSDDSSSIGNVAAAGGSGSGESDPLAAKGGQGTGAQGKPGSSPGSNATKGGASGALSTKPALSGGSTGTEETSEGTGSKPGSTSNSTPSEGGTANSGGTTGTSTGTTPKTDPSQPASCTASANGHYQMEDLDRGVVAVKVGGGVYVGWRMMGYEYDTTASNVEYNLYKDGKKLATVKDSTNYLDAAGTTSSAYSVAAVVKGTECAQSEAVKPWAQEYLDVPITSPGSSYSAGDSSPGDLDGDGQYDIVLKWDPSNQKDSSQAGTTDPVIIDGVKLDGTRLFRINIGMNIRAGAHDTQLSVYDFDGDGKAEVAFKTAPGTKDGKGNYLKTGPAANADHTKDYRSARGMALGGPEWLTVFSGATGEELATMEYPVLYGSSAWGDTNGNRSHRYNGGVSFVSDTGSGKTATGRPSIITQRGYYTRMTITAVNWRDGALKKVWTYDSSATKKEAYGKGNHSLMTADVDGDGAMELIPGASTINSDGTFRCATTNNHGDALHVGELVKGKGITVFMPHEDNGGHDAHDASTCKMYFNPTGSGDNGRGTAEWVSASNTTAASCTSSAFGAVHCDTGATGGTSSGTNFLIFWDADESRELLDGKTIKKAGGDTLLNPAGVAACNGTKNTPNLTADILGDWREELILHTTDNKALRIFTTTAVTKRRLFTLMHDPTYRMQVTFEQSTYNQPPHVGFHLGAGMASPTKPSIHVK